MASNLLYSNRKLEVVGLYRIQLVLIFFLPSSAVVGPILRVGPFSPFVTISAILLILGLISVFVSKTLLEPTPGIIPLSIFWIISIVFHEISSFGELTEQLKSSVVGLALIVGISLIPRNVNVYISFAYGMILGWFVSSFFAITEIFFGFIAPNNWIANNTSITSGLIGLTGLFTNPNNFAFFLLIAGIIVAPLLSYKKNRLVLFSLIFFIFVSFIFLWLTESRIGIFLAFLLGLSALVTFLHKKGLYQLFRNLLVIPIILASILLTVFAYLDLLNGRNGPIENFLQEATIAARVRLIAAGFNLWTFSPIFGLGDFEQSIKSGILSNYSSSLSDPHNGLIEILSEFGFLVFIFFIFFMAKTALRSIRFLKNFDRWENNSDVQLQNIAITLLTLIFTFPIISTMHSTFVGSHAAWLYLAAIIVLDRSIPDFVLINESKNKKAH